MPAFDSHFPLDGAPESQHCNAVAILTGHGFDAFQIVVAEDEVGIPVAKHQEQVQLRPSRCFKRRVARLWLHPGHHPAEHIDHFVPYLCRIVDLR